MLNGKSLNPVARGFITEERGPLWLNVVLVVFAVAAAMLITAVSFALSTFRLRRFLRDVPGGGE